MNRKPPESVRRQLRMEVGFGCPVSGCGSPYLEWHHFDPPWHVRQHHDPRGMIALCRDHHIKADHGSFTNQQLLELKAKRVDPRAVRGKFDWRRNKLLAFVGGNFYYETPRILVVDGIDVVKITRDEDGYLLLNAQMLSLTRDERVILTENCWECIGNPTDVMCPPSGKQLMVSYANGDRLDVKFSVIEDAAAFAMRFQRAAFSALEFPLTVVEVNFSVAGTQLALTPAGTTLGGIQIIGNFMANCGAGVNLNPGIRWRQNWGLVPKAASRLAPCPCGSGRRYKHCHGELA